MEPAGAAASAPYHQLGPAAPGYYVVVAGPFPAPYPGAALAPPQGNVVGAMYGNGLAQGPIPVTTEHQASVNTQTNPWANMDSHIVWDGQGSSCSDSKSLSGSERGTVSETGRSSRQGMGFASEGSRQHAARDHTVFSRSGSECPSGDGTSEDPEDSDEEEQGPRPKIYEWSAGSIGHEVGQCKPCNYLNSKRGCLNGKACTFCHQWHKRPNRPRPHKHQRVKNRRDRAMMEMQAGGSADPMGSAHAVPAGRFSL